MIPLLASLFALQPDSVESGPGVYTHTVKLPEPLGVRFESMAFDITGNGRMTVTGTVRLKNRRAFLKGLGVVARRSRGMRRHIRRVKAGRRG